MNFVHKKTPRGMLSVNSNCCCSLVIYPETEVAGKFYSLYNIEIPVSKGQKAVRACTIRLLNLGHAKYEKVAIYAVNQRISNIWRIAGAA